MGRIQPEQYWPQTVGKAAFSRLPGQPDGTRIDLLRLSPGITLARSQFSPAVRHCDDIVRKDGEVMIAFNLSGCMTICDREGRSLALGQGEAWVIRCGRDPVQRVVDQGVGCSNLVISLTPSLLPTSVQSCLDEALGVRDRAPAPFRQIRLPVPEQRVLLQVFDESRGDASLIRKEGQCWMVIGAVLEELTSADDSICSARPYGSDLLVQRVQATLAEQMQEQITLAGLCHQFGVSHVTLNRAFQQKTGQTVFEYLRDLRLKAAEQRIVGTGQSLTLIAYECGFSSPSHLSTAFKTRYGISARAYREQAQTSVPGGGPFTR